MNFGVLGTWIKSKSNSPATYQKLLQTCCMADVQSAAKAICDMLKSKVQLGEITNSSRDNLASVPGLSLPSLLIISVE